MEKKDTSFAAYKPEKPVEDWTIDEVVDYARKVLTFDDDDIKALKKAKLKGQALFAVPSLEALVNVYGIPPGSAGLLWAEIEKMKKSLVEPEAKTQTNDIIAKLEQKIALLEHNFTKLSLQGKSSSAVAETAKMLNYYINLDQCLQDLVKETSTDYIDFEPTLVWSEDKLLQQFIKHFTYKDAKLCFVDTHSSAPPGMTKKPDAILVREEMKNYKSAMSIVCVVELKKENQLNIALGQVIKDMMELVDIQTKRTTFFGIYGNKVSVGFLKMVVDKDTPFSFFQAPLRSWKEASINIWQLLATNPTQLGFIPPVILKLGSHGMVTNSRHKKLKGTQVVVYKLGDPISGGTKSQRCTVAPCYIENNHHSTLTLKRSEEDPLVVVIKYSASSNSDKEIATEIESLAKFEAVNAHVDIYQSEALLFPIPILLGCNITPNEKYPYLLTYPLGKPLLVDKSNFEDVAKELNLALVLAHSKALFHGDVSPKNIVMHCNKPVLIDWAYSIQKGKVLPGFTGTMTFASIAVTRLRDQIQDYEYHARDDFESLFYTLLYLASGDHLPWSNKKYLSAAELANAKRRAVTDNWSETKLGIAELHRDIIPILDDMCKKLFTDETVEVESLFADAITELSKRMATIK